MTLSLTTTPVWKPDRWLTMDLWIKWCLEFLWEYEVQVEPLGTRLPVPREGDKALMKCFTLHTQDVSSLCRLNQCRMAKQVMWLSEVFSAEGSSVAPEAWE